MLVQGWGMDGEYPSPIVLLLPEDYLEIYLNMPLETRVWLDTAENA